jgi:hypothetical protein
MTTADYIDWDEGRDFPKSEIELPTCESCSKPAASLTYQPDWDFHACPDCIAACERELAAEREPECTCQRIDVDVYDARGCEAHDRRVA